MSRALRVSDCMTGFHVFPLYAPWGGPAVFAQQEPGGLLLLCWSAVVLSGTSEARGPSTRASMVQADVLLVWLLLSSTTGLSPRSSCSKAAGHAIG